MDIVAEYNINSDFFDYIETYINCDTTKLLLSKKERNNTFDIKFAILQIECKKRVAKKIPEIAALKYFLYPSALSTEQCTSQIVAQFHASLLSNTENILDLTAGLGIDDYYIADKTHNLTAIEKNVLTAAALLHNMNIYRKNITVINNDACVYLESAIKSKLHFDAVFIDPARRGKMNERTYELADCEPDVLQILNMIKEISDTLYIKASPMLDITQLLSTVPHLSGIYVIGVDNECKELLLHLNLKSRPIHSDDITISTLNFDNKSYAPQTLSFNFRECRHFTVNYNTGDILQYLYDPNCCIMKSGAFPVIAKKYPQLLKLGKNAHLFTCDTFFPEFPGRLFNVIETIPFKEKYIKQLYKRYPKANIATRNFKIAAHEIKKKLKIQDGGDIYIFATTVQNKEQVLIITHKICQ